MGARRGIALGCLVVAVCLPAVAAGNVIVTGRVDVPVLYDEYAREEVVFELDAGLGLGALVGYGFELGNGNGAVILEGGGGYTWNFDPYQRGTGYIIGGGQIGFGGRLLVSVYFHMGWGASEGQDGDALLQRRGLYVDFGLAVMFRVARIAAVGIRIGYNALVSETGSGTHTTHWLNNGIQTIFSF